MAKLSILGYTDTLQHHSHGSKHNNKPTTQFCQIHFPATIVSSQPPYFLLSCVFKMFNMCFTSEASASILRDDRKRVTNMNNETTVSRWIDITTSNDFSSRSRRVVTTRQHFQPASKPPVSSQIHDFFLSLSPPDISNSRVDFFKWRPVTN